MLFFFPWSLQSIAPKLSRLQVKCQAPADSQYSCLPVRPVGQKVTGEQEDP